MLSQAWSRGVFTETDFGVDGIAAFPVVLVDAILLDLYSSTRLIDFGATGAWFTGFIGVLGGLNSEILLST